ncbi:MAG: MG2 domain-containing protein, partial [Saprospiraceae bacterium]|nr:MG2 domain-containing protein [Saprospiraceae bacterium]
MAKTSTPRPPSFDDYADEWAKIDSLEKKGLPKSALERTEALYARAKADRNTPQIIKALLYRGKYITQLEEDGFEKAIALLEQEEKTASEPERSVLQSLLGELYSIYLQNMAWRIEDRTPLAEGQQGDIKTWSAEQIELQALRYYRASVANVDVLRATPADHLKALLTKPLNDSVDGVPLRPTLFDILAHRALKHFADERSYLTQPAYEFDLDQPEAFAPAAEFVRYNFASQDTNSGEWLAIRLFQQVLAVHLAGSNTAALIDADLLRLQFARNKSTLSDEWERYAEALRLLSREHYNHPSEAEIAYHLGSAYRQLSEQPENAQSDLLQQAVAECESAMARHPNTYGAALCQSLVQQIRRPSVQIQVEQVYLPDKPSLMSVSFKNIQQAHVRVVALPDADAIKNERLNLGDLLALATIEQRAWNLNAPEDFREHRTELRLPPLPVGHYAVLVSPTDNFDGRDQPVSYALFACSHLAGITYDFNGATHVAVVHRETGAPLAGVLGEFFEQKWDVRARDYRNERIGQGTTGKDGLLRPQVALNRSFSVRLSQGKDTLWLDQGFYRYPRERNRASQEVVFFTDRSLYRPGQTVYFKGILLQRDPKGMPRILPGAKVQVTFYDANGQPKGQLALISNEYGTFNGAFQAPTSGLTGAMSIRAEGYSGQASFSVEEYKRPKFEVTFQPIEGSYRVGDVVKVRGEAKNYAGNSVDGAQVRYRVVRQTRIPWWWSWRIWPPFGGEEVEIANGITTTAADGSFEIAFTALPDRKLPEKDLPTFQYTVKAHVTDITGETRSNETTVSAGYVALNVDLALPQEVELQDLRKVPLKTTNNAGQPQNAEGTIEITRLVSPQTRFLERYWPAPDVLALNERDFRREFPLYAWNGEDNPEKWGRQDFTRTLSFRSSGSTELDLDGGQMPPGHYEVVLKTRDAFGKPIEIKQIVRVWDAKTPATRFDKPAGVLEKNTCEPGEVARLWLGGGQGLHFLLLTGREGKTLEPRWLQVSGAQSADIAVQEADRGGIGLNAFAVQHNRFYQTGPHSIAVPWSNKELNIAFETFRDRLAPGDRETWRLRISGPKKEKVAAELVAAMYDASLDQFLPHGWSRIGFPGHYHSLSLSSNGFGSRGGNVRFARSETFVPQQRKYAEINWFDFPRYYGGRYPYADGLYMMRADVPGAMRNKMADGEATEAYEAPP